MTTRSSGGTLYPSLTELTGVTPHDLGVVSLDSQYSHYPKEVTATSKSAASSRKYNGDNIDDGVRSQRSSLSTSSLHDPAIRSGSGHSQDSNNSLDRKPQAHHALGAPRQRTASDSLYDDALSVVSSSVLREVEAPRPQRQAPKQMSALDRLAQLESSVTRVKPAPQAPASAGPGGLTRSQSAWIHRSMPKPPPESSPPELERATPKQEFKSTEPRQPGRSLSLTGPTRGSMAPRRAAPSTPRGSIGVEELHRRLGSSSSTTPTPEPRIPRNNSGSDLRHHRNHSTASTNLNSSVRPVRRTMSLPRQYAHSGDGGGIASLGETFDVNLQQEKFQQAIDKLHSASGGNRPHPGRPQLERAAQPHGSHVRVLHNPVVPIDSKSRQSGKLLGPDSFHARQEELQAERELERARSMREFTAGPRVSRRGKKSEILASSRTPSPPALEEPPASKSTAPEQADDSDLRRSATKPKRASSLGAVLGFGGRRQKKEVSRHRSEPGSMSSSGRGKRTVPTAPTSAEY